MVFGLSVTAHAQGSIVRLWLANSATNVSPDTHLVIAFLSPPALGNSGTIRIYDAADNKIVDTLDMSIPAGPDFRRRPAGSPPDTQSYQLNTIGGHEGFHFYPVIVTVSHYLSAQSCAAVRP
jgi:pectinesterase